MPDIKNNIKIIYNALSKEGYKDLGSEQDFANAMQHEEDRRTAYNLLQKHGYSGFGKDEKEFSSFVYKQPQATPASDPSDSSDPSKIKPADPATLDPRFVAPNMGKPTNTTPVLKGIQDDTGFVAPQNYNAANAFSAETDNNYNAGAYIPYAEQAVKLYGKDSNMGEAYNNIYAVYDEAYKKNNPRKIAEAAGMARSMGLNNEQSERAITLVHGLYSQNVAKSMADYMYGKMQNGDPLYALQEVYYTKDFQDKVKDTATRLGLDNTQGFVEYYLKPAMQRKLERENNFKGTIDFAIHSSDEELNKRIGIFQERKQEEEQLRQQAEKYKTIGEKLEREGKEATDRPWWTDFAAATNGGIGTYELQRDAVKDDKYGYQKLTAGRAMRYFAEDALEAINEDNILHTRDTRGAVNYIMGTLSRMWRGGKSAATDLRTWDTGITDLSNAAAVKNANAALKKGTATADEKALLNAVALHNVIMSEHGAALEGMYGATGTAVQMIPFMMQMAANPASGLGKGIQKLVQDFAVKGLTKRFGKYAAKATLNTIAKGFGYAGRFVGDVAEGTALTLAYGMPAVTADATNRQIGEVQAAVDKKGNVVFNGTKGGESAGKAFAKAFTAHTIENQSELTGEYLSPLFNYMEKGITKGLNKVGLTKVTDFITGLNNKQIVNGFHRFMEKTHWNGIGGEFGEEVLGNIENALTVGDLNLNLDPDDEQSVFSKKLNWNTFLGVAVGAGFLSGVQTASYLRNSRKINTAIADADTSADVLLGTERWNNIKEQIDNATADNAVKVMKDIINNNEISEKQAEPVATYAKNVFVKNGLEIAHMKDAIEQNIDNQQAELESQHENGYTAQGAQLNVIKTAYDQAKQKAQEVLTPETIQQLENTEDFDNVISTLPEEQQTIATDYINTKAAYQAMIERVQDNIHSAISRGTAEVDRMTHKESGNIIPITLKDNNQEVYIISGNVVITNDGSMVDYDKSDKSLIVFNPVKGKQEMIDPHAVLSVGETINAQQRKKELAETITQTEAERAANEIETPQQQPATFEYEQQVKVKDHNGNLIDGVVEDVQGDDVLVVSDAYKGGKMYKAQELAQMQPQTEQQVEQQQTPENNEKIDNIATSDQSDSSEQSDTSPNNQPTTQEAAQSIIQTMEDNAVEDPNISLTPQTWLESFGINNSIETPIGRVKMGENQYAKLQEKNRTTEFGMVALTLSDPDVIFIEPSQAKDNNTERAYSYVFAKTFKRNGEKIKYFTLVTVAKEGLEISVSSHFVNPNKMKNKLMEFERAYTKETLLPNSSEMRLTEHQSDVPDLLPTQGNNVSSEWSEDGSTSISPANQQPADTENISALDLSSDGKVTQSSNNEQETNVKNQETNDIPTDEKGNTLYERVPIERTVADLYDGSLDDTEIKDFIQANIDEAQKAYNKINNKPPKITTNKQAYLSAKAKWKAQVEIAKQKLEYWNKVEQERQKLTHTTPQELETKENELSGETAREEARKATDQNTDVQTAEDLARLFIRDAKITPESFRQETGLGVEEQRKFVGMISTQGKTIARLGEKLVETDNDQYGGIFFRGDSNEARSAIIDVLIGSYSKKDLKPTANNFEEQYAEEIAQQRDEWYYNAYHLTYEEYLQHEETIMPEILRQYSNFDEQHFYAHAYEAYHQQLKNNNQTTNNNEQQNNTNTEEPGTPQSNTILQNQEPHYQGGNTTSQDQGTTFQTRSQSEVENGLVSQSAQAAVDYKQSNIQADNGEYFYQDANGNIDLAEIPDVVFDTIGKRKAPFRLTPSMLKHVFDRHGKEMGLSQADDAIDFVLDVMDNFDHVRQGEKGAVIFSIENGRNRTGRRAVTILLDSTSGEYYGIKTSGYERIEGLNKKPLLWEKGANETSATGVAPANVTTEKAQQGNEPVGSASNHSNDSDRKDKQTSQTKQENTKETTQNKEVREDVSVMTERKAEEAKVDTNPTKAQQQVPTSDKSHSSETKQPQRLVSDERMEELKKRLREKLRGQLNIGIDPELLAIGTEIAVGHIERGVSKFSEYAKTMIEDLGDTIRPYLKAFYNGARDMPELGELADQLTPYEEVRTFNVATIGKEGEQVKPTILQQAEQVSNEHQVEQNTKEEVKQTSETTDIDNELYSITKQHNQKKDVDIWVVRGKERVERDLFLQQKQVAKESYGYYSSFRGVNGFVFNTAEDAKAFADKAFNTENKENYAQKSNDVMRVDNQGNPIDKDGNLIIEKVGSISELADADFEHPTRSVELPAIPQNIDEAIGANGKPVIIKKNIFEKNKQSHHFSNEQSRIILKNALYNTDVVGQTQPIQRSTHWVVIQIDSESPITVLEVNDNKDNVEVVGWYTLDKRNLERIKRQAEREGGELLMLSTKNKVESLSTPTDNLPSVGKDTQSSHTKQEIKEENTITERDGLKIGDEEQTAEPQPIGYGDFGAIYNQFKGKANEAIKFLLSKQDGETIAALHHKDIGDIDLVWGKEGTAKSDGFGLAKLAKYHPEVLDNLQEILEDMIVIKRTNNRVQLESEKYQAAVRLTWDSEKKNWLLTMFEKKNSALNNTTDTDKTPMGNENDTATPENAALSDSKDKQNVLNSKKNNKKVVTLQTEGNLFDTPNNETTTNNNKENGLQRNDELRSKRMRTNDTHGGETQSRKITSSSQGVQQESERTNRRGDNGRGGENEQSSRRQSGRIQRLNTNNNHVERGVESAPASVDARIEANIKAIELANELVESGEKATPEQMRVLRKFSGWGGLGKAFSNGTPISRKLQQMLGAEAYEQAVMSANSAYYTPAYVIDTLWDIAKQLGFKGGNVLEGSAGIGNIIGQMPMEISDNSYIQAVEIDGTSGNILSLLYPEANVEIQGFEQTRVPNGSIDLAITNVPFVTGLRVNDTTGDSDLSKKFHNIHDFCIAKNVRKLCDGGIGIFISSNGTLDSSQKLRDWLVNDGNADVIGAFRLNNKTFGGTGVTSDIIIIRKRVGSKVSPNAIDVSTVTGERSVDYNTGEEKKVKGTYVPVIKHLSMDYNKYFIEHPEMMAGKMEFAFEHGDTYRATSKGLYPTNDKQQEKMLQDFVNSFAHMKDEAQAKKEENPVNVYEELGDDVKEGSMLINKEGKLCVAQFGQAVPLDLNTNKVKGHTKEECFNAYQAIKQATTEVLQYEEQHENDKGLQPLLDKLNKVYDNFVSTYGHLNNNPAISFLKNDVDFANIAALEKYEEKGDEKGNLVKKISKTDIFNKRVIEKETEPKPTNIKDAVIISIHQNAKIDIPYICQQLNISQEAAKKEIIESGLGFEDPVNKTIEVSYQYLTGNVREKLRQAKQANENGKYENNIKALKEVIPNSIPAHLIEFTLGSSWIDPKMYNEFVKDKTGIDVKFTPVGGTWFMEAPEWEIHTEQNKAAGVYSKLKQDFIYGHKLIEAAIQNKNITITKTTKNWNGETETETDKEAMQACTNRIDEIRQEFKEWARNKMQSDLELSTKMEQVYNDTFNNYAPPTIPKEFVPKYFKGQKRKFKLYDHQRNAVIRATMQSLMLAHEVGAGKTFTLIATAMEMRRLGTARKPMIVVQNATVGQFVADAKELYPNAKILTLEDNDRNAEGRKRFYAKIKYNDWDMIIVPQSTFQRIPDSEERQIAFIKDKIEEKLIVLEKMKKVNGDNRKDPVSRQAEHEIETLQAELAELTTQVSEKRTAKEEKKRAVTKQNAEVKAREMLDREVDDVENFDDMGIDALLVDEAHEYKHLGFATAMQRGIKGVDPSYSKKSQSVFLKTQAILQKNHGRNVVFATGTPISNTAAEIWTFMRYLMPADTMKEYEIYYFDDFVRNFGNIQQMLEFTTSGKFKENNRFAGYVNLPELVRIWSMVSDTILTKETKGVADKLPQMETGKAQDIYLTQTKALRAIMKAVRKMLEEFEKMSGKEKKENSHIPLNAYGIANSAAIDARLVDATAQDEENSKTNVAVKETLRTLKETEHYKGTVAIFADKYQNKISGFNLYEEVKNKLVKAGIPKEQIVVMKSGMSIKKKQDIFDKVNSGEVRVILGSTATLGTGVNIQQRLHTLIHLDAPNRPMDYTQRNGRILRQGNTHKDMEIPVRILRFGVEDSLDVTAYQRLKTKGAIADSIMNGKQLMANNMENRILEEEEDAFGDTVAQLSGSEYAMLKNQAEKNVRKYESRKKQWETDQTYIHNTKPRLQEKIEADKAIIDTCEQKLQLINEVYPNGTFKAITIGKQNFGSIEAMADFLKNHNKKIKEQGEKLKQQTSGSYSSRLTISINGLDFEILTEVSKEIIAKGANLFTKATRKMTYSQKELGIKGIPVKGGMLKAAIEDITENIITGKRFKTLIDLSQQNIKHNQNELKQVVAREGKPFEYAEELEDAKAKYEEYTELMKKEMEEKEKKYAEMDNEVQEATNLTEMDEEEDNNTLYRNETQQAETTTDPTQLEAHAKATAQKLNLTNVEFVTTNTHEHPRQTRPQATAKGYYQKSTGQIVININNHTSLSDVEKTVLHEAVAHYGLRELFGSEFDNMIEAVFTNADPETRLQIMQNSTTHTWNYATATEEYLATMAEDTNFDKLKPSVWQRIKQFFGEMLSAMGLHHAELTDNDLRYMLWRSYQNLKQGGKRNIFQMAEDYAMQHRLKVRNHQQQEKPKADKVNKVFNEKLGTTTFDNIQKQVFDLGKPSTALLSGGVENKPIKLYGSKIAKKIKKHGFTLQELKDLPKAVANPIAVFDNYKKEGNRSILTELKTKQGNFLVSIDLGKGMDVDFDIVSSVFGKNGNSVIGWINQGFATYINKEKALNYLHLVAPIATASNNQELNSAAKIIKDFENPKQTNDFVKPHEPYRRNGMESNMVVARNRTLKDNDVLYRKADPAENEVLPDARTRYEHEVRKPNKEGSVKQHENLMHRLHEAYTDSMDSLRSYMDSVLEATGDELSSHEDVYKAENAMSSKNKSHREAYERDYYNPMLQAARELCKATGMSYETLQMYIVSKHGLERNALMRKRDIERVGNNDKLRDNAKSNLIFELEHKDYSGLTALFGLEKTEVDKAEQEAQKTINDVESNLNAKPKIVEFWERVNAATKATLKYILMTVEEKIAHKIKVARERKGYSQRQLSSISGIHYSQISRLENATNSVSVGLLDRICKYLELELELKQV